MTARPPSSAAGGAARREDGAVEAPARPRRGDQGEQLATATAAEQKLYKGPCTWPLNREPSSGTFGYVGIHSVKKLGPLSIIVRFGGANPVCL
jgi:hypothetical protein